MAEKLKEINNALAKQIIPDDYDERPRKVIFRENPVDCVIPPTPSYSSDEDDGYGDSTEVSDDLPDDNEGDFSKNNLNGTRDVTSDITFEMTDISAVQERKSDPQSESITDTTPYQSKLTDRNDNVPTLSKISSSPHPPDDNTFESSIAPQMNSVADEIDYIFKCFSRLSLKSNTQPAIDQNAFSESVNEAEDKSIIECSSSSELDPEDWIPEVTDNHDQTRLNGEDPAKTELTGNDVVSEESQLVPEPPSDYLVNHHSNETYSPSLNSDVNCQQFVKDYNVSVKSEALLKWKAVVMKLRRFHSVPVEIQASEPQDSTEIDVEKTDVQGDEVCGSSSKIRHFTSPSTMASSSSEQDSELIPTPPKTKKTSVHKFRSRLLKNKLNDPKTTFNDIRSKQNSLFPLTYKNTSASLEICQESITPISEETTMIMASQGKFCVMKTEDFQSGEATTDLSGRSRSEPQVFRCRPKSSRPPTSTVRNHVTSSRAMPVSINPNRPSGWEDRKEVIRISSTGILNKRPGTTRQTGDIHENSMPLEGLRPSSASAPRSSLIKPPRCVASSVLKQRSHTAPVQRRGPESTYRLTLEQKLEKER